MLAAVWYSLISKSHLRHNLLSYDVGAKVVLLQLSTICRKTHILLYRVLWRKINEGRHNN